MEHTKLLYTRYSKLPSFETTQRVASEGLRVRPLTVLVAVRLRERQDSPLGETDESDTATHCIVVPSVNKIVPS